MSLANIEDVSRYGSVITNGDVVVGFREKGADGPGMVNAGAYACRRDLLDLLPDQTNFLLRGGLPRARASAIAAPLSAVDSGIIDIGTPESYAFANAIFGP